MLKEVAVMSVNQEECIEKVLKNTKQTLETLSEILGVDIKDFKVQSNSSIINQRISLFADFLSKYSLFI